MKFYDMISNYGKDILDELPNEIQNELKEIKFGNIGNSTTGILNDIWEVAKDKCKNYINTDWIENSGIKKDILFEDIKYHSIFTLFLSIINKDSEKKTIVDCIDEYGDLEEENSLGDNDVKKGNSPEYALTHFDDKFNEWVEILNDHEYSNGFDDSDLSNYFIKGIQGENAKDNDSLLVDIDPIIFYNVIKFWKECPYNKKYSSGMAFKKLNIFYNKFQDSIEELENNNIDKIDKIIQAYTIERLFNISFVYRLANYVSEKNRENIEKDINRNKEEIEKYKEKVEKDIEKYKEGTEEYKVELDKQGYYEDVARKSIKSFEKCNFILIPENYEIISADTLLVLSEIVSIPMVFCRNRYIEIINTAYERSIKDNEWVDNLRSGFSYLNDYMIPLLLRVYYYLIFSYMKSIYRNGDIDCFIKKLFKEYIKENSLKYSYEELIVDEKYKAKKHFGNEAFQVNVTKIVYNYKFFRGDFNKNEG